MGDLWQLKRDLDQQKAQSDFFRVSLVYFQLSACHQAHSPKSCKSHSSLLDFKGKHKTDLEVRRNNGR
jgi:hypothetical protein